MDQVEKIELQVGVKVLLKNSRGKYLLLYRNADKYSDVKKERWDIVGGRIDPGKPLFENLVREVMEETKLELIKEPKLIHVQDILIVPGKHIVRLTYSGEIDGEPVLDDGEHDSYKWLDLSEIKEIPAEEMNRYFKEVLDKSLID